MQETLTPLVKEAEVEELGVYATPPPSVVALAQEGHITAKSDTGPFPEHFNLQGHIEGRPQHGPSPAEMAVVRKVADEGDITNRVTWGAVLAEEKQDKLHHIEAGRGIIEILKEDFRRVFGLGGRKVGFEEAKTVHQVIQEQKAS